MIEHLFDAALRAKATRDGRGTCLATWVHVPVGGPTPPDIDPRSVPYLCGWGRPMVWQYETPMAGSDFCVDRHYQRNCTEQEIRDYLSGAVRRGLMPLSAACLSQEWMIGSVSAAPLGAHVVRHDRAPAECMCVDADGRLVAPEDER